MDNNNTRRYLVQDRSFGIPALVIPQPLFSNSIIKGRLRNSKFNLQTSFPQKFIFNQGNEKVGRHTQTILYIVYCKRICHNV